MKYTETKVGKSINPTTGEEWWRADQGVILEDGDDPTEAFIKLKNLLNGWLPSTATDGQAAPSGDGLLTIKESR